MVRSTARGVTIAALLLCASFHATEAQAQTQAVKPNILLLFDTSGSMIWPVCYSSYSAINGDNSVECPGSDVSCANCNTLGCGNGIGDDPPGGAPLARRA